MSKTRKKKDYGKFKSHFELEVSEKLGEDNYEISKLEYTIPAKKCKYTPDFTIKAEDGHNIYYELKGHFIDKAESDKYIHVRDSNPNIDLRFIIQDEKTLMPRSKRTTIKKWLEDIGFQVYTLDEFKKMKKK